MKALYFFSLVALLPCAVQGQNDFIDSHSIAQALAIIPQCAQLCFVPVLDELPCNITTLQSLAVCLCPNDIIQGKVSACVEKHCNFAGQIITANANQQLCKGIPIPARSHEVLVIVVAVTAVTVPFVLLRIWSRLSFAGKFGMDDWAMLVAASCVVAIMGIEVQMALGGWGNHIWTLDVHKLPTTLMLFYSTQILYVIVQCFTKLSILLFYLRIFPQRGFVISSIATIVVVVVSDLAFVFIVAFQCIPVASIWDKSLDGKCLNHTAIIYSGAGLSILEHVIILILPIPCISALKVGKGKRISLFVMFSIGTFALVASLVRLKYIGKFGTSTDATWDNADVEIWSAIEIAVALICACLPALRPLLTRYVPILFGSSGRTRPSDYYHHTFDGTHNTYNGNPSAPHQRSTTITSVTAHHGTFSPRKIKTENQADDKEGDIFADLPDTVFIGKAGRILGQEFERRVTLDRGTLKDKDGHARKSTMDSRRWSGRSSHGSDVELVIMGAEKVGRAR